MAAGQGKDDAKLRACSARIPDRDALLLDATEQLQGWAEAQNCPEQVGLFGRIPYVSRLFAEPPPRRAIDHVLLLVSPRVLMAKEETVGTCEKQADRK